MSMGDEQNQEEQAMEQVLGVAQAALTGMMVHMRPLMEGRIREVLERNEGIVNQSSEALAHLSGELYEALFTLPENPFGP